MTAWSGRHRVPVAAGAAVLAVTGLVLALGLSPSASTARFADGDAAGATARYDRAFGDEPVVILVKGRLTRMLLTADVQQLLGLEGCLSGNLPPRGKALAPVCREFARRKPVQVVYGPGTFINDAAGRILDRVGLDPATVQREADAAARRAIRAAKAQGLDRQAQQGAAEQARTLATTALMQRVQLQTGIQSVPALNNPRFVLQLVFEPRIGAEEPKPRFAYVFPDKDAALIQVRLRSGLSDPERAHAIDMLRQAVASPAFSLAAGSYVVTGDPVLRERVASSLPDQATILLVAAVLFVAVALALASRARFPLLPLLVALVVAALAYGIARLAGAELTLAMVALLPLLVALAAAVAALLQGRESGPEAPRVAIALVVVAVGLVALLASPVPMTRAAALVAILGIALALVVALTVGAAAPTFLERLPRGRFRLPRSPRLDGWGGRAFAACVRSPTRTLLIAAAIAVAGWVAGTQVDATADLARLVPPDRQAVRDVNSLRDFTGSPGQVSVLVRGADLSDPPAIAWMAGYQGEMLTRHGYSERRPCRTAELCPALSPTNVFASGLPRTKRQARRALSGLPRYFARSVITPDRRTASIGFVLADLPPDRREAVIDDMRTHLHPPAGLKAEIAGAPAVEADSRSDILASRWTLGLAAILLLLATLFALYRRVEHALVPLVPAVLATGWTALAVWILQVPLNAASVVLGAVLIAVGTGLGTILYGRYAEARAPGRSAGEAIRAAWAASGDVALAAAVLAAGCLAPLVSDFKGLRDFGAVALAGVALELLAVTLVLPATVLVAEAGVTLRVPRPRRAGRAVRALAAGIRRVAPSRK